MKRHHLSTWTGAFLALLVLTGCCRRPIEVIVEKDTHVRINVDWTSHFGERPSGMTVRLYPVDGSAPITHVTNDVDGIDVGLTAGTYYLLVFNQTEDEYGSMTFTDMQHFTTAAARATRATLHGNSSWDKGVDYYADPEPIGVAVDTITITPDMVEEGISFERYRKGMTTNHYYQGVATYTYDEVPLPMTSKLNITVHIQGIGNMRSVAGYITGMADGFTLYSGHRLNSACVLPLDTWKGPTRTRPPTPVSSPPARRPSDCPTTRWCSATATPRTTASCCPSPSSTAPPASSPTTWHTSSTTGRSMRPCPCATATP